MDLPPCGSNAVGVASGCAGLAKLAGPGWAAYYIALYICVYIYIYIHMYPRLMNVVFIL